VNEIIIGVQIDVPGRRVGFHVFALSDVRQLLLKQRQSGTRQAGKGGGRTSSSHLSALNVMIGAMDILAVLEVPVELVNVCKSFEVSTPEITETEGDRNYVAKSKHDGPKSGDPNKAGQKPCRANSPSESAPLLSQSPTIGLGAHTSNHSGKRRWRN
jgi:hypothetical protein